MSLITRCPTCETMFKVVPDQLRVSEGWVRCGQCAEIFDATQNMVASADADLPGTPAGSPPTAKPPTPPSEPPRAPEPATAPKQSFFVRPAEPQVPVHVSPPAAATPEPKPLPDRAEPGWDDAPATDPETVFLGDEPDAEPRAQALASATEPVVDLSVPDVAAAQVPVQQHLASEPDEPPLTFLRESEKPSVWRRPVVRWSLALVLLALLALLIVQVLRMERDRIAAVEPATRPLLQAICALTDCVLAPLRQIESVVIDSSSFSRVHGDDYRLGFALRNTAPIAIAMPSIELSLTDPQDQAVIRRVIEPAEFASGAPTLAKSSVWSGSLALTVRPGTHTERVAGYRLLAFYP
jgi:predicted Zn finger-like uncharacterized protein